MPKEDIRVTAALQLAGFFENKESYVDTGGHLILRGMDKARVRPIVFRRFKNRCVICNHVLHPDAEPYSQNCGAWHHPGPCSCVGCTELRCDVTTGRPCHAHRTEGFQRKADVQA